MRENSMTICDFKKNRVQSYENKLDIKNRITLSEEIKVKIDKEDIFSINSFYRWLPGVPFPDNYPRIHI